MAQMQRGQQLHREWRPLKSGQMQGGRVLRNEARSLCAAVTKGEAQRRRWPLFSGRYVSFVMRLVPSTSAMRGAKPGISASAKIP